MTDHSTPPTRPGETAHQDLADRARQEVLAAIQHIVLGTGGQIVTRPIVASEPDGPTTPRC